MFFLAFLFTTPTKHSARSLTERLVCTTIGHRERKTAFCHENPHCDAAAHWARLPGRLLELQHRRFRSHRRLLWPVHMYSTSTDASRHRQFLSLLCLFLLFPILAFGYLFLGTSAIPSDMGPTFWTRRQSWLRACGQLNEKNRREAAGCQQAEDTLFHFLAVLFSRQMR